MVFNTLPLKINTQVVADDDYRIKFALSKIKTT